MERDPEGIKPLFCPLAASAQWGYVPQLHCGIQLGAEVPCGPRSAEKPGHEAFVCLKLPGPPRGACPESWGCVTEPHGADRQSPVVAGFWTLEVPGQGVRG